jgi:hypothetical protein
MILESKVLRENEILRRAFGDLGNLRNSKMATLSGTNLFYDIGYIEPDMTVRLEIPCRAHSLQTDR